MVTVRKTLRELMAYSVDAEEDVRNYCVAALALAGFRVYLSCDNVYARRDDDDRSPVVCLNAHLDSVRVGIGADDRCGITAIIGAVNQTDCDARVLLTTGEETGGIGAGDVPLTWWPGIALCASFDRHGNTDIITHYAGRQLAPIATLERVAQIAERCGMPATLTRSTSMADAYTFAEHVEAVNIATGFYDEHSAREHYVLEDVETAACVAAALIREGESLWTTA